MGNGDLVSRVYKFIHISVLTLNHILNFFLVISVFLAFPCALCYGISSEDLLLNRLLYPSKGFGLC